MNFKQGIYPIKNTDRYDGDLTKQIVYRSSWEYNFMEWLDTSPVVKSWNSEEVVVPYEVFGSVHRYFIDFCVKLTDDQVFWIEIKPKKYQSVESFENEKSEAAKLEYIKNIAKWTQADIVATKNDIKFCIVTEEELGFFVSRIGNSKNK